MIKKFFLAGVTLLFALGAGCISFGSSAPGPMGLYRSSDKGDTWQPAQTLLTPQGVKSLSGAKVYRLFTDPTDPNALYLATRGQGLYYSYNKAASWQFVEALGAKFIYSVAVDPEDKCTIYVTDGASIFKTTDCLRTWKTVYTEQRGQRVSALAVEYGSSAAVYAAFQSGELLKSVTGGQSWRSIYRAVGEIRDLQADPQTPGRFYLSTYRNGLFRSDNSGVSWIDVSDGIKNYNGGLNFFRLVLHPKDKNHIFWLSRYGILRSDNAGSTWVNMELLSPPGSVNVYSFAVSPLNFKEMYYVGTILGENNTSRSTFYKSTDGGVNWITKKLPTNTIPINILIHPSETGLLFLGFTILES